MVGLALETIELATLLPGIPGPQLVNGLGVEEMWKAEIYAESGSTIAYVKMLEPQQVISEVVCALLGVALELNMPTPFLVYVERVNLNGSQKWKANESSRVCFGSEDAKHPSFRQIIKMQQGMTNALLNELLNWSGYKPTAWFDEWTANNDRHPGNLLYDGKEFWLIDHGHAFTGPQWMPSDLDPDRQVDNRFLQPTYVQGFTTPKKEEWKIVAGAESLRYQAIAFDTLRECGMMDDYSTPEQRAAIVNFLAKRAEYFMNLACDRLGIPRPLI